MENITVSKLWNKEHWVHVSFDRGMGWGLLGGLAGTMVMDLVLMGVLSVVKLPTLTCYSIVGETVAHAFSMLNIEPAGFVLLGIVTHYLVGPLVGAIFGAAIAQADVLQINTLKKFIGLAILYVEILSQPILATTPILLKMTGTEILLWFGGSFAMHFIFAIVLGIIVGYGLRQAPVTTQRRSQ